jgi:hypothetical protein
MKYQKRDDTVKKEKCEFPRCKKNAEGILRTKYLCKKHYILVQMDNIILVKYNISIPNNLKVSQDSKDFFTPQSFLNRVRQRFQPKDL